MRKESIFKKNKELDNSMTIAAFISLIWCIGEDAPLSFLEALSLAGLIVSACNHKYKFQQSRIDSG
jgi:hypothetical protein